MEKQAVGSCPLCGGAVFEDEIAYNCSNWRDKDGGCKFHIWKTICGRTISAQEAETLLDIGSVGLLDGFISKKNRPFSAFLYIDKRSGDVKFNFSSI